MKEMTKFKMKIHIIRAEDLAPEQRAAILQLCSVAFETDYGQHLQHFHGATHVVAYEGDHLMSHALWVTRWLQPGDLQPLRTAYVEGVATSPSAEGRGYGTAVMRRLADAIQDFELGALATGKPGFYARLGWERWQGPGFVRTAEGLVPQPATYVMILRLPATPPLSTGWPLSCEWRPGEIW